MRPSAPAFGKTFQYRRCILTAKDSLKNRSRSNRRASCRLRYYRFIWQAKERMWAEMAFRCARSPLILKVILLRRFALDCYRGNVIRRAAFSHTMSRKKWTRLRAPLVFICLAPRRAVKRAKTAPGDVPAPARLMAYARFLLHPLKTNLLVLQIYVARLIGFLTLFWVSWLYSHRIQQTSKYTGVLSTAFTPPSN